MRKLSIKIQNYTVIIKQENPKLMVFAYIDPGTGSIILQAVIGAALGAAVAAKLFWHRILHFFGVKNKETSLTENENENIE